ncbi:hypothetical protein HXX76_004397 [Chlamydomonas incerta]|uniref:Uncharacterized protein n=1 Tax=Chlamydomonas incerta TaxID=51695 RepID=A0A835TKL2_CHLIN|nr:hypothetical protein HXX76_004397 [Chlamydomonas incerta]|eukprot:KAG2440286.1 hypothetical protein HXX76_004397 [Chlamydomonas incerta]
MATTRSGVMPNLQLLLRVWPHHFPLRQDVYEAAAAGGHVELFASLLEQDLNTTVAEMGFQVLEAAAGCKRHDRAMAMCRFLEEQGAAMITQRTPGIAAAAGNAALAEWLLRRVAPDAAAAVAAEIGAADGPRPRDRAQAAVIEDMVSHAAGGLELPALKDFARKHAGISGVSLDAAGAGSHSGTSSSSAWRRYVLFHMICRASVSPSASWRDKVLWLHGQWTAECEAALLAAAARERQRAAALTEEERRVLDEAGARAVFATELGADVALGPVCLGLPDWKPRVELLCGQLGCPWDAWQALMAALECGNASVVREVLGPPERPRAANSQADAAAEGSATGSAQATPLGGSDGGGGGGDAGAGAGADADADAAGGGLRLRLARPPDARELYKMALHAASRPADEPGADRLGVLQALHERGLLPPRHPDSKAPPGVAPPAGADAANHSSDGGSVSDSPGDEDEDEKAHRAARRAARLVPRPVDGFTSLLGHVVSCGSLAAVRWCVEVVLGGAASPEAVAQLGHGTLDRAAMAGSVPILRYLVEGCGCATARLSPLAFMFACRAGSEGLIEYLVKRGGCPMAPQEPSEPWLTVAAQGDVSTLACLERLGCPWRPSRSLAKQVLQRAEGGHVRCEDALHWLHRVKGCPINTRALRDAAAEFVYESSGPLDRELIMWGIQERDAGDDEEEEAAAGDEGTWGFDL